VARTAGAKLRVSLAGGLAHRLLSGQARGKVLAVVSDAVYLVTDQGELIWLGGETLVPQRRALLGPLEPESFSPGVRFQARAGVISFSTGVEVELRGARVWSPSRPVAQVDLAEASRRAREVLAADQRGLQVPPPLTGAAGAWEKLLSAWGARDASGLWEAAQRLVGLGPGLTPWGDDLLGGFLFAAWHLGRLYPEECGWLGQGGREAFLNQAHSLTGRVSWTLLSDLAQGHGPAPLHRLLGFLVGGRSVRTCLEEVTRLAKIGATSGGGLAQGVLAAVAMA
jgi:hypothetical protein